MRKQTDTENYSQSLFPPRASMNGNRASLGLGDMVFGSMHKKRRRGTQNSRGKQRLDTILQHDEEIEERQRKNTYMKRNLGDM